MRDSLSIGKLGRYLGYCSIHDKDSHVLKNIDVYLELADKYERRNHRRVDFNVKTKTLHIYAYNINSFTGEHVDVVKGKLKVKKEHIDIIYDNLYERAFKRKRKELLDNMARDSIQEEILSPFVTF